MVEEKKDHTVNKRSAAYMFGQIMARLDEGDKLMVGFTDKLDGVSRAVFKLPCPLHEEKLTRVEEWQEKHEKAVEKVSERKIALKHGVILSLLGMVVSAVITFVLALVFVF